MRVMTLLLTATLACGTHAEVPREISYQGFLTTSAGIPVTATIPIMFKIYDVASGGTELYSETQTVTVTSGLFNVRIGSVDPIGLPFDVQYFLGVSPGAEPEMTPRQPLTASPYAIVAESAEMLAGTAIVDGSQITGTIGANNLETTQRLPPAPCATDQIPKWSGEAWVCAPDSGAKPVGTGNSNYFITTGQYGAGCNGGTNITQAKWIGAGGGCNTVLLTIVTNGNPILLNVSLTGYWTAGAASDFKNANVLVQIKTSTGSAVTHEYNQWGSTGSNSTANNIPAAIAFSEIVTLPAGSHTLELWGRIQNGDSNSPKFNMDTGNYVSISAVVLGESSN